MAVDPEVIRARLASLIGYLQELESFRSISYQQYLADLRNKRTVERLIQLIVEVASDINSHIIAKLNSKPPADHHSSFTRLVELGILPAGQSEEFTKSVGLRNRLVHEYDRIDDTIVLTSIPKALSLYRAYVGAVESFLER